MKIEYRWLTEEELDALTRFNWWWPLLGGMMGFLFSGIVIVLLLVLE